MSPYRSHRLGHAVQRRALPVALHDLQRVQPAADHQPATGRAVDGSFALHADEVSDSCHANSAGQLSLGTQALAFWGAAAGGCTGPAAGAGPVNPG